MHLESPFLPDFFITIPLKRNISLCFLPLLAWAVSSCATIIGGSRYNAHIRVSNDPRAKITVDGQFVGRGEAVVPVKRSMANKFSFVVESDECDPEPHTYTTRTFRGWAFFSSLIFWTGSTSSGIPLPFGIVIDAATGSLWKPNTNERGVTKINYKNFQYLVTYNGCENKPKPASTPVSDPNFKEVLDVIYLKNGSIVRGIIYEVVPNTSIRIRTKDGNTFLFNMPEIEKMTKE